MPLGTRAPRNVRSCSAGAATGPETAAAAEAIAGAGVGAGSSCRQSQQRYSSGPTEVPHRAQRRALIGDHRRARRKRRGGRVKDVGLVGVPYSGASTLFTALTRTGATGGRSNQAVVDVPDPRLGVLTELEHSRKVVAAQVRFVDVPS